MIYIFNITCEKKLKFICRRKFGIQNFLRIHPVNNLEIRYFNCSYRWTNVFGLTSISAHCDFNQLAKRGLELLSNKFSFDMHTVGLQQQTSPLLYIVASYYSFSYYCNTHLVIYLITYMATKYQLT